jgi:hypothetical protein
MTSPFKVAEFVGGPLDGTTYERRDEKFPRRLPIQVGNYVELYVARIGRLGNVIYRYAGRASVEVVT